MVKNNHYGVDTINSNLIVSINNNNNNNNYTKHQSKASLSSLLK